MMNKIRKLGSGLAVRLPKKVKQKKYTIEKLLKAMKAVQIPDIVDWGKPVGKEIW